MRLVEAYHVYEPTQDTDDRVRPSPLQYPQAPDVVLSSLTVPMTIIARVQAHFHFLERLAHHDVGLLKQLFAHLQAHPARFDRAHQGTVLWSLCGSQPFRKGLIRPPRCSRSRRCPVRRSAAPGRPEPLDPVRAHQGRVDHPLELALVLGGTRACLARTRARSHSACRANSFLSLSLYCHFQEAVPAACVEFSRAQLATYSKLRQLDVLLEQLLPSFVAHSGGHAHYIISSRQFTKQYPPTSDLPMRA